MSFQVHIAIGVLLLALTAGLYMMCKSSCGDTCSRCCKIFGKIFGILISLIAVLTLACALYCGTSEMCSKTGCFLLGKTVEQKVGR